MRGNRTNQQELDANRRPDWGGGRWNHSSLLLEPLSTNDSSELLDLLVEGGALSNDLRAQISERIGYYVGTGSASDRALKYAEIDVNNESWHRGPDPNNTFPHNYWNVYGVGGVAGIQNEVAQAIAASGATTKVFLNEYNKIGRAHV